MMYGRAVDRRFEKLDALCDKIQSFAKLPTGWDGEQALAPRLDILGFACKLLRELPGDAELPAAVAPDVEGEIGLTWVNGPKQLNAILYPDHHLMWVKRTEAGGRFMPGAEIDLDAESYPHRFVEEVVALYR